MLDEKEVAELGRVAQERELVLVAAVERIPRLDLAGVGEPHPRLSDEIETHVRLRDVLFEHGPVADPFAQPLREDERRIAEPQQILEELFVARHGIERGHRCFTSSGIGKNVGCR